MSKPVGIVSYATYLPAWCISTQEIAQANNAAVPSLGVVQKTVPALDEDTATIATQAALNAFSNLELTARQEIHARIGSLWVGSESHPYAVNPTGTVVKAALGLPSQLAMADLQFACKAGTQGLQVGLMYVRSQQAEYSLAIGADTAQAEPGDALEYTAAAGGAAFIVGSNPQHLIAKLLGTTSYATDTPDFWRRPGENYPQHGGRFTGEPAYYYHVMTSTKNLLAELDMSIQDFDHCVFHTPNGKFPQTVAKKLGCGAAQLQHSLVVKEIGNTYAGAAMITLANVLDHAEPGDKILMTAYGSGAGADSFVWEVTPQILTWRENQSNPLAQQISQLKAISYSQYTKRSQHDH